MPSPHTSITQLERQPSPLEVLPSSHSSVPSSLPLPHTVGSTAQLALQPSPLSLLPSSQVSPLSSTPSPQPARRQSVRQLALGSSELALPASHCSPLSGSPLPHTGWT